jgi:hypothetical protein
MDEPTIATFEPWADPIVDRYDQAPEGTFSRLAWLPLIGPSSWLIWGTLAAQLRHDPTVTWNLAELAAAHGLGRSTGTRSAIGRTLTRMAMFPILGTLEPGQYLVRLTAPPMSRGMLTKLPDHVAEMHRQIYQAPPAATA